MRVTTYRESKTFRFDLPPPLSCKEGESFGVKSIYGIFEVKIQYSPYL